MKTEEQSLFDGYGLSDDILEALSLLNYKQPTRIQMEVIPVLMEGKNAAVKAPTGSGKTAAFAIPVCEKIDWDENLPQALILEPTRELAVQVKEEIFHIGRKKRLKVPVVFGGFPIDKQIRTLKQKSHVVVGTPGRLMDHMRRETLRLDRLRFVVIDEADLMLDMGFFDEVKEILSCIPEDCPVSLFSATLKPEVMELVQEFIHEAVLIETGQQEKEKNDITQKIYEVNEDDKYKDFMALLMKENPDSAMIFCGTRQMVNVLFQKLRRNRIFCGMIHGEMDQKERLKTVEAFRRGGFRYLIATDVAARGIDFEYITHVFNYDFPTGRETYIHRIGRVGRNGKSGTAVSLVGEGDRRMHKFVEEYLGRELPIMPSEKASAEEEKIFWSCQRKKLAARPDKGAALSQGIARLCIGGGRKSKIRAGDLVGAICGIEHLSVEDIGIIDIRESLSYVEILHQKGEDVVKALEQKTIKGKLRKVRLSR